MQAALRDHPIRGDKQYGAKCLFGPDAPLPRGTIIAYGTHAGILLFLHPIRYEPITFDGAHFARGVGGIAGWIFIGLKQGAIRGSSVTAAKQL